MALVEINAEQCSDPAFWPDCCARCGAAGARLAPVPLKYAKHIDGLTVPLCRDHFDDWANVSFRTRIGAIVILVGMAVTAAAVWELQPELAGPNNQDDTTRLTLTIILGFFSAIPLSAFVIAWAKTPIRVTSLQGRMATLAGVCRAFAAAAKAQPPPALPEVSDAVRFEVQEYQPSPVVAPAVLQQFVLISFVVAAALGVAVGLGGLEIGQATRGWEANDWRYPFLTAAIALCYVIPILGFRAFASRYGLMVVTLVVGVSILGVLMFRLFGGPQRIAFYILFSGSAFLMLEFAVVHRLIRHWRIRSVNAAVLAGAAGSLLISVVAYFIAEMEPGPHQAAYVIGPLAAISFASLNRMAARQPFCTECDAWLVPRRIGALPRTVAEVRPIIASGQVVALTGIPPYLDTTTVGDVDLWLYSCPECRENGTVVLELFNSTKGGKDGKTPTPVRVGRWLYPGIALPVIEEIYPPPAEANPPPEPPDES
jgi:hypothetical protein